MAVVVRSGDRADATGHRDLPWALFVLVLLAGVVLLAKALVNIATYEEPAPAENETVQVIQVEPGHPPEWLAEWPANRVTDGE